MVSTIEYGRKNMALLKIRSFKVNIFRVFVLSFCTITLVFFGLRAYLELPELQSYQLHKGMTTNQVSSLMGKPDLSYGDKENEYWCYSQEENINLHFTNNLLDGADAKKGHPLNSESIILQK
jgi:hypothetical protein